MRSYTWDPVHQQWVWTDPSENPPAGIGGAPTSSDDASIGFVPGYSTTFSDAVTADTLVAAAAVSVTGFGTLTGNVTAGTIDTGGIVYTADVTADTFQITNGDTGTGTVTLTGGTSTIGELLVGGISIAPNELLVTGNAAVTATNSATTASVEVAGYGDIEIDQGTLIGTLISVNSGTIDVNSGGSLQATSFGVDGGSLDGPGTVTVNSGAVMTTDTAYLSGAGLGTGSVVVTGGTWTSTASLAVGLGLLGSGTGVLSVINGGSVIAQGGAEALGAGVLAGSTGSISIAGSGSTLDVASGATATIGGAGTGTLAISGGGAVSVGGDLIAGATAGASGGISVDGSGSTLDVGFGTITVGQAGTGSLGITGGGAVSADVLLVGESNSATGAITISGAGSSLDDNSGALVVGNAGTGAVTVSSGSLSIGSGALTIAATLGSSGKVALDDCSLSLSGQTDVGAGGLGSLKLQNLGSGGAAVTLSTLMIGDQLQSQGSVSVDGQGSQLTTDNITSGNLGGSNFKVSNSAVATTVGDVFAGMAASAAGSGVGADTGAVWSVSGTMEIGVGTSAGLKVTGGATVSAAEIDLGIANGATGNLSMSDTSSVGPISTLPTTLDFGQVMNVGVAGLGTAKLSGNATLAPGGAYAGTIVLGESVGASGTISLSGSQDLVQAAQMIIGVDATGGSSSGLLSLGSLETASLGQLQIGSLGTVLLKGGTLAASIVDDFGTVQGTGTIQGVLVAGANGVVDATGGSFEVTGAVGGPGPVFDLDNKGTLVLDSTVAATTQLDVIGSKAALILPDFTAYQNATIINFGTDTKIFLPNLLANKGKVSGDELILEEQTVNATGTTITTVVGSIAFTGMDSTVSTVGFKVKSGPTVGVGTTISNSGRILAWDGAYGASVTGASNWYDLTDSLTPALAAPGTADVARFTYNAVVTGATELGLLELEDPGQTVTFAAGASLLVDSAISLQATAAATVAQGATLATGGSVVLAGALAVAGDLAVTGALSIAAGGIVTMAGGVIDPASGVNAGTVIGSGELLFASTFGASPSLANSGTVIASGGGALSVEATLTGSGSLVVDGGSALVLGDEVAATQNIAFAPGAGPGVLILDAPGAGLANPVSGLVAGDTIELGGFTTLTAASLAGTTITATGTSGGAAATYLLTDVTLAPGSVLGTGVDTATGFAFVTVACFAAGTRIVGAHGAVAVDRLRPGDLLRTAGGALRPVRWIGHRSIDLTRHPDPRRAQPIRIRADAFADGIPARDLLLSPDHAVFDRGRLIPIRLLVNGATITRETRRRKITYYHVELDSHDLLLAEGLPAESYLDCNNRGIFQNAPEPLILHPDFYDPAAQAARRLATSCAPLTDAAKLVAPLWWRLADRAVALGFPVPTPSFTTEPALAVRAGGRTGGRTLAPAARDGATYRFALPAGPATLLSRAAYPQDATPWLEDQRRLGVMVRALRLGNEPIPLDHPTFTAGWWAPETDGTARWRWTDGEAVLGTLTAPAELAVTLGDTLPYPRRRAA